MMSRDCSLASDLVKACQTLSAPNHFINDDLQTSGRGGGGTREAVQSVVDRDGLFGRGRDRGRDGKIVPGPGPGFELIFLPGPGPGPGFVYFCRGRGRGAGIRLFKN